MMQLFAKFILSYYLINYVHAAPKTSAETGNDIENFLMGGSSIKELTPKTGNTEASNKKPDNKFMEDLIEVQRTYRSLKEKWHRMMVEKNQVIQAASSTPSATPSSSDEVQVIDVDVFEAPDKFQDISSDNSEFDDEAFVDISATSSTTLAAQSQEPTPSYHHVASELDQIQMAIREAFGGAKDPKDHKISLSEIITPKVQMDGVVTTIKMDQTTPISVEGLQNMVADSDEGRIIPQNFAGPVMLNARTTASPMRQDVSSSTIPVVPQMVEVGAGGEAQGALEQAVPGNKQQGFGSLPAVPSLPIADKTVPSQINVPQNQPVTSQQSVLPAAQRQVVQQNPPAPIGSNQQIVLAAAPPPPPISTPEQVPLLQQVPPGPLEQLIPQLEPNLSNTQHDLPSPHGVVTHQSQPTLPQGFPSVSTVGSNRPAAPFPKVATPWRHKMESMDQDPFDPTTPTTVVPPTLTEVPQYPSTPPTPTTPIPTLPTLPTTTSTELPMHILPTSSFHSSGAHPDSLPATNLFRYPDQVKIPFFGGKGVDNSLAAGGPMRPTTPESFRSDEIPNLEPEVPVEEHKKPGDLRVSEAELQNSEDLGEDEEMTMEEDGTDEATKDNDTEVEVDGETDSRTDAETETDMEEGTKELAASEETLTSTPRGIENNEDYVEDTFSHETGTVPASFGIGKAPSFEESIDDSADSGVIGSHPSGPRPKAFGSVPSSSGPVDSGFGGFGSPPGSGGSGPSGLGTFGSKRGPDIPDFGSDPAPPKHLETRRPSGQKKSDTMEALEELLDGVSLGSGPNGPSGTLGSPPASRSLGSGSIGSDTPDPSVGPTGSFGSPPGSSSVGSASFGSGPAPPVDHHLPIDPTGPAPPTSSGSFGIGRSPPGFTEHIGPTLPPSARPQKPSFPTLVEQVDNFFNDEDNTDTGASSALGSFGSDEVVANVPVSQNIQVLEDPKPRVTRPPVHMPTSRNPIGIFGTKLQTINQKAYKPPMFSSALNSDTVKMVTLGNPYLTRTTVQPIGPHGLAEPVMSADMELPAWNGVEKDRGIMNKARREYQKEFEQQTRDVRIIDEEINRISKMNDDGRSKSSQRCSQVYAHTLSLSQIQKMSHSLGLGDVATVIQRAADLTEHRENDIAQLELDLEEKRKLIAKVEILLSFAESRALLFDLLNEQKKIAEKMENHALDLLQKNTFRPHTPSPFSAASDISELSSAVQQVLNAKSVATKKGWSMMKRKLIKKSKVPKKFEVIDPSDVVIKNEFIDFNKKAGHLQETAEIVEPILSLPFVSQNDQFGRLPVAKAVHKRVHIPLAPPTMSPTILVRKPRPSQLAAQHLTALKPLTPPGASESETVHELIDMLHEDIVKLPAEEEERICRQVQCDFEKADLCNFESSHDETTRLRLLRSRSHRQKRSSALLPEISDDLLAEQSNIADDLLPYTFRAWSIWAGRRAERTKQIDIGPNFSSRNHHFAAVFLEPQQAGILSIPLVLSPTSTKIRLRLFEGTRGIRLRICCDRYCPLETEQGLYRGHRSWLRKTLACPPNTQTLSFECLNDGPDRGACGVDDVFVDSNRCHHFFNGSDQN